jgi:hypothetical protein
LAEHVLALPFDLILQELGVSIRPHRHRWSVGKEVDPVVMAALRGQATRLLEDVIVGL